MRADTLGARWKSALAGSDGALGISKELHSFMDLLGRDRALPDGSVVRRRLWSRLACISLSSAPPAGNRLGFRAAAAAADAAAADALAAS